MSRVWATTLLQAINIGTQPYQNLTMTNETLCRALLGARTEQRARPLCLPALQSAETTVWETSRFLSRGLQSLKEGLRSSVETNTGSFSLSKGSFTPCGAQPPPPIFQQHPSTSSNSRTHLWKPSLLPLLPSLGVFGDPIPSNDLGVKSCGPPCAGKSTV